MRKRAGGAGETFAGPHRPTRGGFEVVRRLLALVGLEPEEAEPPPPMPGVMVLRSTPCGRLLDRFISDPKLHSVGISDSEGRLLGIVDRQRLFALVDLAGEEIFGTMPADRLLHG